MMRKPSQKTLVRKILELLPDPIDHFRKLIIQEDQKKAEKDAREYCNACYHVTYGEEMDRLKSEIPEDEQRCAQLKKAIAVQEQVVAKTPPMIRVADMLKRELPDKHERDARKWLDILLALICLIAALLVLGMGASNVYSIIMASGTPVFLEQPELAMMLSGLLPLGAFALEFFKRNLYLNKAKDIYNAFIFGSAAVFLLIWIVLFALVYGSPGDDILDFEQLLKPAGENHLATMLTIVQLLAELFVGAALFTSAGDLFAKHSPTRLVPNPDYIAAKKLLEEMKKDYAPIVAALIIKKARLAVLEHGRMLYLSEQMASYERLRAQLAD